MIDTNTQQTNWKEIYQEDGIFEEGCWKTCQSYCCHFDKVTANYTALERTNNIPLFPGEYAFLNKHHLFQEGFEESHKQNTFTIRGIQFTVETVNCHLKGLCTNHQYRPMICRLYPVFPVVNIQGHIQGFEPLAPVDMFWKYIYHEGWTLESPCSLRENDFMANQKLLALCERLLRNPFNIFYTMLAKFYKDALLQEILNTHPDSFQYGYEKFFTQYEATILGLGDEFWSPLRTKAEEVFDRLQDVWGENWYNNDDGA